MSSGLWLKSIFLILINLASGYVGYLMDGFRFTGVWFLIILSLIFSGIVLLNPFRNESYIKQGFALGVIFALLISLGVYILTISPCLSIEHYQSATRENYNIATCFFGNGTILMSFYILGLSSFFLVPIGTLIGWIIGIIKSTKKETL